MYFRSNSLSRPGVGLSSVGLSRTPPPWFGSVAARITWPPCTRHCTLCTFSAAAQTIKTAHSYILLQNIHHFSTLSIQIMTNVSPGGAPYDHQNLAGSQPILNLRRLWDTMCLACEVLGYCNVWYWRAGGEGMCLEGIEGGLVPPNNLTAE